MAHSTRKRPLPNRVAPKESLHFFKIILPHTIAEKKLAIPVKFVGKFGHELPSFATLVLPSGKKWEIGLTKANDRIWLDDGWHEFVKHHSIRNGHFVFFRYERNSTFHVIILDSSAYEVDYPSDDEELNNGENERDSIHDDSETEEDCSIEILEEITPNSDERDNREAISRNRDAPSVQIQDLKQEFDGKKLKITIQRTKPTKSGKQELHIPMQDEEIEIYVSRKLFSIASTPHYRERAIRAAEILQPKNPCFMIILRPCNFITAYMSVPVGFATEYLTGISSHIKVEHSDGRGWFLELYRRGKNGLYLRKGCNEFWRENDLKQGDVLMFELRDPMAAVLKLSIFRASSN